MIVVFVYPDAGFLLMYLDLLYLVVVSRDDHLLDTTNRGLS